MTTPGGSGTGPEQALEAIKLSPRAQREKPILSRAYLRAQARSRGALPYSAPKNGSLRNPSPITSKHETVSPFV